MSGDVVAAIDAALADYSIGPDAMRWAPDEPAPAYDPWTDIGYTLIEDLARFEGSLDAAGHSVYEFMQRAMRTTHRDFTLVPPPPQNPEAFGFTMDDVRDPWELFFGFDFALWPKGFGVPAPRPPEDPPEITYEPVWPPPFVAYTGQTALTMEAPRV
ncbi:hypothetical protein [Streptomonospora halophila]|uniref:hypothetical protein n=1 Tax=Streptomonospora halophila TaxID=427369 RepID=UPI0031ECFB51